MPKQPKSTQHASWSLLPEINMREQERLIKQLLVNILVLRPDYRNHCERWLTHHYQQQNKPLSTRTHAQQVLADDLYDLFNLSQFTHRQANAACVISAGIMISSFILVMAKRIHHEEENSLLVQNFINVITHTIITTLPLTDQHKRYQQQLTDNIRTAILQVFRNNLFEQYTTFYIVNTFNDTDRQNISPSIHPGHAKELSPNATLLTAFVTDLSLLQHSYSNLARQAWFIGSSYWPITTARLSFDRPPSFLRQKENAVMHTHLYLLAAMSVHQTRDLPDIYHHTIIKRSAKQNAIRLQFMLVIAATLAYVLTQGLGIKTMAMLAVSFLTLYATSGNNTIAYLNNGERSDLFTKITNVFNVSFTPPSATNTPAAIECIQAKPLPGDNTTQQTAKTQTSTPLFTLPAPEPLTKVFRTQVTRRKTTNRSTGAYTSDQRLTATTVHRREQKVSQRILRANAEDIIIVGKIKKATSTLLAQALNKLKTGNPQIHPYKVGNITYQNLCKVKFPHSDPRLIAYLQTKKGQETYVVVGFKPSHKQEAITQDKQKQMRELGAQIITQRNSGASVSASAASTPSP